MEPENPTPEPVVPPNEVRPADASADFIVSTQGGDVPPEPHGARWVFMGPQGLRAGWSIAIFFSIVLAIVAPILVIAHFVQKAAPQAAKAGSC